MLLKERFKYFRNKLDISQKEVAKLLGASTGKIKQIEAGNTQSISYDDAKKIENKYNISEKWLRFEDGDMYINNSTLNQINILEQELKLDEDLITLPYYDNINASAGYGCHNTNEKVNYIKIPRDLIPNQNTNLDIIKVHGDSMEDTIFNNDLIFVDKAKTEPINGKVYIILFENELYVKRYFKFPNSNIIFKSDNQLYPHIEVDKNSSFKIIGLVVGRLNQKVL